MLGKESLRGQAGAAALVLAAIMLGGCIGATREGPTPPTGPTNSSGLSDNETIAPNGAGRISAFNETNKTDTSGIGSMMHTHDYWHGRERIDDVAWINNALIPLPLMPCKQANNACSLGSSTPNTDTYPVGTDIADFDLQPPPTMGMIYEGTSTVIVTLKELDTNGGPPNPLGQVFFDYLAANDEPGHFHKGAELKLGAPVSIPISPLDADMPHQTKSLWVFRIYSNSEMGEFGFNITISIVKGYPVVNWPPHPDLYADHPTRVVFDGPVHLASKGSADGILFGSDAGWISPQRVISWGTDSVTIDIKNVQFTPGVPAPSGTPAAPKEFVLEVRNASSPALLANFPNWITMKDPGSDGKSYHFVLDLTKDRGDAYDTPYAQYSRWGFRLIPIWEDQTGCESSDAGAYVSGCQWYPWDMTYTMTITAAGHSIAGQAPPAA
jgi:hypothetical protein